MVMSTSPVLEKRKTTATEQTTSEYRYTPTLSVGGKIWIVAG